jgi:hypothetical protein
MMTLAAPISVSSAIFLSASLSLNDSAAASTIGATSSRTFSKDSSPMSASYSS